jgi:glycosyltransferase involved in cell wall biosynthesis
MKRSLRILQIVPSVSLIYGGPSQMVLGLSKGLAHQGVDVTILTTDSNGDTGQVPLDVPLDRPVCQDGYQIRYFHCSPFRRYKFSVGLLGWLVNHAQDYDVAHIHALFSPVSSMAAAIARAQKLPYILRPLGTLDPADLQKKRQVKRLYAALLERPNLAGAAAVHFTSDPEAKLSERFGVVTRDVVLPLGVDLPFVDAATVNAVRDRWGIDRQSPLLLFMSRVDPKKGFDLLLPALEKLQAEGSKFHFVLAGANPQDPTYEQQIYRQIQASAIASQTTLTGFVRGQEKAALLQAADLFVLPSYYENFGIAVAEAMSAGIPVVISDRVQICDAIAQSQSGWVAACTVNDLADQLRAALQDATERQRRGANAQTYAQRYYGWEAIAQQMIEVYRSVLEV